MCTMGPYAASLMSLAKLTSKAFCYAGAGAQLMDLIGLESNMPAGVAGSWSRSLLPGSLNASSERG